MKIVDIFSDLEKANAYITQVNAAYAKELEGKLALETAGKLLQKSLDAEIKKSQGLATDLEAAQALLAEATQEISDLGQKLDLTEKHGSEGLMVTVNKTTYCLIGDTFVYGGSVKTAAELSKDAAQLAKMIKTGSGSLVEVK